MVGSQQPVEKSELPVQEKIQLYENVLQQQQQRQQQSEESVVQALARTHVGKRPLPPTTNDHDTDTVGTIQLLLAEVMDLRNQLQKYTEGSTLKVPQQPMEVNIATPDDNNRTTTVIMDNIQGPKDPWGVVLGHDDLHTKINQWAVEYIETGKLPKPQIVVGTITDVIGVVKNGGG